MKTVTDRIVQYANRYKLTNVETGEILGTFDFDEVTGTVQQVGTEIDKELFDSIAADFTDIINGTQPVGAVGATQITTQDLNTFYGADWWGKMLYMAGGNSVLNKPAGIDAGNVNILRGAFDSTIQIAIGTSDSTGNSPAPNIYIRRLIGSTSSWDDWEQIVTADGNYPTLGAGESEMLTEPFAVGKDTTTATTGYVKFASVSLPGAYRSASARFEVLDKNPVNAQTQMCGVEVVARNISETRVTVTAQLLYGSSAYLSKIYACVKKGSYPVLVDLYFDITSSNPQETISCIKPLFTFTRVTRSTTFTFISDNEPVTALPTDTTNTQLSTVCALVTEAADSAKLNGRAASEYALADDLTAHETNISNPHSVTKEQVGLGNVDNTADTDKPVSTAQATAIAEVQGNVDKIVSGETAVGNAEKLGNKAASEYALTSDIPDVSNFAEKDGTYNNMIVGKAIDSDKLGGKSSSSYALKTEIKDVGYSLYIKNKFDFALFVMQCNNGTLPENITSVLFDGSEGVFSYSEQGIKLPATLKQIQGINNAEIYIGDFQYDGFNNKAALWYEQKVVTHDYCIRDIEVRCFSKAGSNSDANAFYNCGNIYNCTAYAYSEEATGRGFYYCNNIIGCRANANGPVNRFGYVSCEYCSNCRGGNLGILDTLWGGTNYKVSIDTCDTNSDGTIPGIN